MNKTIAERLALIREEMRREGIDAFVFPSSDPHGGEYVPAHWKGREYVTGFGGSAGTAVVTAGAAALWTDSRYFIAAAGQLEGTEFELMRDGVEGTPDIAAWLGRKLAHISGAQVAADGMVNTAGQMERLADRLRHAGGITLRHNFDILQRVWQSRPPIPLSPIEVYPDALAGETAAAKMARLRQRLGQRNVCGLLMAALDDIAWLLNLRGTDVHCNPVFVAYLLIEGGRTTLFADKRKITPEVAGYLAGIGVDTDSYLGVKERLAAYSEYNIMADPDEVNYTLYNSIAAREIVREQSPVKMMKAVKTEAEINGFRSAMLRDGVAMAQFLHWLDGNIGKRRITELDACHTLAAFRAGQPMYRGLSFDTIAAYGPHGAIVHYEPTPGTDAELQPHGLFLIDSGAQYLDGTTDITRTVALGPLTDEERRIYTLVLKAHIQLELCKFPAGASGTQIDALARQPLWRQGLNFMHGTGHGVGSYLGVHEGPHQIRMEWRPAPLLAGMTVTDEPGIYIEGRFGVRIENTLLATEYMETAFGRFLQFEPLTICPIDKRPILAGMLTAEERGWLNAYHRMVQEKLSPLVERAVREWLEAACAPL